MFPEIQTMDPASLMLLIRVILLVAFGSFMVKIDVHKRLFTRSPDCFMYLLPIPPQGHPENLV